MKIYAISDLHVDFEENRRWISNISQQDYQDDILILAGDITDVTLLIIKAFEALKKCFKEVFFVPGNHDLGVLRSKEADSLMRFETLMMLAGDYGIRTKPMETDTVSIIPLFGWYDYSFGPPSDELNNCWTDFTACKWPDGYDENKITEHFLSMNEPLLKPKNKHIISFSHFLPRIDLMPSFIPGDRRKLYPAFGTILLERQIRQLSSHIHVFGHSHFNMKIKRDQTWYINNAFGYPYESHIASKRLVCIYENDRSLL